MTQHLRFTYQDAVAYLEDHINDDGGLYNLVWYLEWNPGDKTASLDGNFSPENLIHIAIYMLGDSK